MGDERCCEVSDGARLWASLLEGRYTIVDRLNTQGRGFLVAQVNRSSNLQPLSAGEREVVALAVGGVTIKEVAFTLRLASSTVRQRLQSALAKMGVTSRSDLVRMHVAVHGSHVGAAPGHLSSKPTATP